ncbi:uncharacterized protein [Triticum aestivum]|uniref:uncharacterized protein isoform X5 n=1 Tax=Triticum aestivum TaxID=4565 RepID=UPI0001BA8837|nr:uncharacterized protein LOC123109447 isoform X5 [Triticum aestivum]
MPSASASASSRQGCGMWDVCPSATTGRTRWQRASPRAREEMTLQLKGASLPEGLIVVASNFNMSCLKITVPPIIISDSDSIAATSSISLPGGGAY